MSPVIAARKQSDKIRILGKYVSLESLLPEDVNQTYLSWMTDPDVNRYLETRFEKHNLSSLTMFVVSICSDPRFHFFKILENSTNRHIGNIKLGPTHSYHRTGDIGLVIGEKDCWGKGYAKEAIALITQFAFSTLKLHKVTAGFMDLNVGSKKAFLANGFEIEGTRIDQVTYEEKFRNLILAGKINPNDVVR